MKTGTNHRFTITGMGVLLAVALSFMIAPLSAAELESSIARGGQLYDKWYAVIDTDAPKASHPAYPADKKYAKKAKSNWRCKECHGWDYRGVDGAYASGKHNTGIKGINGMAGADTNAIINVLQDQTHDYAGKMDAADFTDLANFVSRGQENMDQYIDRASKSSKGNAVKGEVYFNTLCAQCHGKNGDQPKDMKKTLGKQMSNPWEVMHKILNGQPDEQMPSLRALDRQITIDILAHLATLPKKK